MEGFCPRPGFTAGSPAAGPFAALRALGLDQQQLMSLSHQGYLHQDRRSSMRMPCWRLRFRHQDRIRTVYVGTNLELVGRLKRELHQLRAHSEQQRSLEATVRTAKRMLRKIKRELGPALATEDLYYHGDSIRKRRVPKTPLLSDLETNQC
jgi:ABC-type cobalamin transport system ATPase subunit